MSELFQDLKNFNADISSWNMSGVTNINSMFRVRFARALGPQALVRAFPVHAASAAAAPRPPASRPCTSPHIACSFFSTRQGSAAFNQTLSWDTSSVTTMNNLFFSNWGITTFNGDISSWDTSGVTNMDAVFRVRPARALVPKP
jgi:surface protein